MLDGTKKVRFIASRSGTDKAEIIDASYWRFARFAGDRIWDRRNITFTETLHHSASPLREYQHGRAPRIDVMRTWPRASVFRKAWTRLYLFAKLHWYLVLGKARRFVSQACSPRGY